MAFPRSVVVVHPGALDVRVWQQVTTQLPADVDVTVVDLQRVQRYALAAIHPSAGLPTVNELADTVTDVIDRVRPTVVAGWSFGGVVAQAALSRTTPLPPDALLLLDSIAPVSSFVMDDDFDRAVLADWFGMYLCAKQGVARPREPIPTEPGEAMLAWFIKAGALRPATTVPGLQKVHAAYLGGLNRNNEIVRAHQARPHPTPTVLIRPVDGLLSGRDHLGWSELNPDTTTVACPGDHYSMFSEPVVARLLLDLLDSADLPVPSLT